MRTKNRYAAPQTEVLKLMGKNICQGGATIDPNITNPTSAGGGGWD